MGSSEIAHRISGKFNGIKFGKLIRITGNWVAGMIFEKQKRNNNFKDNGQRK